ncbi:Glycosyl transferase family 3 N-terminal domain [Trinorchestia longiramus]|nr:Glycosyl transferase family 3 N-terminal domain [Trinorchestia longiramus]
MDQTVCAVQDLIAKKASGGELLKAELEQLVTTISDGTMDDVQLGALLMAIFIKGMNGRETADLTLAMKNSGTVMEWPREWVVGDKHSTGGVGDKVSLPLTPALASCGLKVPMISGRGLGHTGGTLDKLESIPGFNACLPADDLMSALQTVGCVITGQTENIVPADRRMYAARDVTGTVASMPLIVSSILSKKAAESLNSLVLDVKFGSGSVLGPLEKSEALAKALVATMQDIGVKTTALLTNMDHPIGRTIGNALEVSEAVECLNGAGPLDLRSLVVALGGELLAASGLCEGATEGQRKIEAALDDGSACSTFCRMLQAQVFCYGLHNVLQDAAGSDILLRPAQRSARCCRFRYSATACSTFCRKLQGVSEEVAKEMCNGGVGVLPLAPHTTPVLARQTGVVEHQDALVLARCCATLGAGRTFAGQRISYDVGIYLNKVVGEQVEKGQPWATVHHQQVELPEGILQQLQDALTLNPSRSPFQQQPRVAKIIR